MIAPRDEASTTLAGWTTTSPRSPPAGRPLCCEVNVLPPNPASLAFHDRLGFVPCGEADDPRNGKRVRYLVRP